jgi:hypothetical protein
MPPLSTPEEQEIARRAEFVSKLVEQLSERELQVTSLGNDLARFRQHYAKKIGRLYAELDRLDALIASHHAEATQTPDAQATADDALARARQSAAEAGLPPPDAPDAEPPVQLELVTEPPSNELKQIYRKAAMRFHPDRATTDSERVRRTAIMSALNVAYAKNDLLAIENLLNRAGSDPEEIAGDDIGSQLIRLIRRESQIKRRFVELEAEIQTIQNDEVYALWQSVQEAEAIGADPLGELATQIEVQIAEKRVELESLSC